MRMHRPFRLTTPHRRSASNGRGDWLRMVWLTALLVALSWQSVVLQSHVHAPVAPSFGFTEQAGHSSGEHRSPLAPDNCPLCDEIDAAGVYTLGASIILVEPVAHAFWYGAEEKPQSIDGEPAHHWRSRAPPLQPLI
ncbi:hypothetical protein [Sphingomonas alpina]|nr:hypothetical protein [Sphingomonas alpina]